MKYRAEINGLRAVAVVPVILFHAGFDLFSGGFVGVDVFFVVSGYLITSILIEDIENKRFSIVNFYERRARRILPALFFIMLVCVPFAWKWMLPSQMIDFSKSLIAVSLFSSNILFWKEWGYFNDFTDEKPLLHTWSLAVEEQYYIIFPIFLILAWRFGKNKVFWMIIVMAAISLMLCEWGWRNHSMANFYLAPTRAWELLIGSIAAFIVQKRGVQVNNFLSLIGLTAIIFSIFAYDKSTPFPSLYALVPVLGTVLLVLFGEKETLVAKILSTKVFVGLGLISYSAYLWHQPLFAFARLRMTDEPSLFLMLSLSILSLIFAVFTWKFIEKPCRNIFVVDRNKILIFSIIGFVITILLGTVGYINEGFYGRFKNPDQIKILEIIDNKQKQGMYVERDYTSHSKNNSYWTENGKPKVLIIGDSYSQDLFNALKENGFTKQLDIMLRLVFARCGVLFIDKSKIINLASTKHKEDCKKQLGLLEDKKLIKLLVEADYVLLASSWKDSHINFLAESFKELSKLTSAEIIVFGTKKLIPVNLVHSQMTKADRVGYLVELGDRVKTQKRMLSTMSKILNVTYLDIQPIICDTTPTNYDSCKPFDSEGLPKSYDGGHLTKYGAIYYGKKIKNELNCIFLKECNIN